QKITGARGLSISWAGLSHFSIALHRLNPAPTRPWLLFFPDITGKKWKLPFSTRSERNWSCRSGQKRRIKRSPRLAREQPVGIAGEAAYWAQRHVTDDAGNPQIGIIDERAGELLVIGEIGADEARDVVHFAAHLPALDHGINGIEPPLDAAAIGLLLQDDLGKHVHRPRQVTQLDHRLVARDDAGRLEAAHPLEAGARRQPDPLRQLRNGR